MGDSDEKDLGPYPKILLKDFYKSPDLETMDTTYSSNLKDAEIGPEAGTTLS